MTNTMLTLLFNATVETLYMVFFSGFFAAIIGIPLGIMLMITNENSLFPQKQLHHIMEIIINITRSIPFIILMIFLIPFTRFLIGTSIGTSAAIVPLAIGAIPFIARLTETALNEIPQGLIESGKAMGAPPYAIIRYILLPEALPALVQGLTLTLITLVGYSAMAGAIGGGGLGNLAINYGYQRFEINIMISTIVILILLVQCIQMIGNNIVKRITH